MLQVPGQHAYLCPLGRPAVGKTQVLLMIEVNRVQTGVRIEASLLKVLKGLAEYKNLGLGDLLEGICLHVFEGKLPFSQDTLQQISRLKQIYALSLTADDSHQLKEIRAKKPAASKTALRPRVGG
jgi:hypothetical protein